MTDFQHKNVLIRGSFLAFAIQSLAALLGFAMNVFAARLLDANGYGLYAYAVSWATVISIFCALGTDAAALRFVPAYMAKGEWRELQGFYRWALLTVVGLSIAVVIVVEIGVSHSLLTEEKRRAVAIGLLMAPAMTLLILGQAVLRGFKAIAQALLPNGVVRPLLMMGVAGLLAEFFRVRMNADRLLVVLAAAVCLAMLYQYSRIMTRLMRLPAEGSMLWRPRLWLSVALPLVVMAALTTLLGQLDILMLGTLSSATQTAFYSAAARFATLASFGLTAANMIVAPLISELYHTHRLQDLLRMVRYVTRLITVFAILVALVFLFLGRPLLMIFGANYTAAYGPALILLSGQVVNAVTGPVGYLLVLTGQQYTALGIYALACLLNVVVNLVAIPRFGMYGAALATAISVALANVLMYIAAQKRVLRFGGEEGA